MKKFLLLTLTLGALFLTISCSHHDSKPEHHHHAYNKKCAYSVLHGKNDVAGKSEHKIEHGGQTYYFSSGEKMELFRKNIDEKIKKANDRWLDRAGSRR